MFRYTLPLDTQCYKVVTPHAHEMSGWKKLSRLIHSRYPNIEGMNGDVKSDLSTLMFKNGEQLENVHIIIITPQQEINLSGETISPTRLLFQYMKALSNSDNIKSFIDINMIYLIKLLDNNGKYSVYTGGNIHVIYSYL